MFYLNRIKFLKNEPVIEILYWSITAPLICSGTVRTVLSEPIPSQDFQSHYACTFRWSAFNSETVSPHYLRIIQFAVCTTLRRLHRYEYKAHSSCPSPLNYLHDSFLSVWSISNLGNSIPQMQSNWPNEEYITSTTGGIKNNKKL